MKQLLFFLFSLFALNTFAQHEYSDDFNSFLERSEINLEIMGGFKLEKQISTAEGHALHFINPNTKAQIHYTFWAATEYMKGNSKKNKKSAKEKKEEESNLFHPNSAYKMTFGLALMKQNNKKPMKYHDMRPKDLADIFHADWGVFTDLIVNKTPGEEGPFRHGFAMHKKDVATVIVFVSGFDEDNVFQDVMNTNVKVSFKKTE